MTLIERANNALRKLRGTYGRQLDIMSKVDDMLEKLKGFATAAKKALAEPADKKLRATKGTKLVSAEDFAELQKLRAAAKKR